MDEKEKTEQTGRSEVGESAVIKLNVCACTLTEDSGSLFDKLEDNPGQKCVALGESLEIPWNNDDDENPSFELTLIKVYYEKQVYVPSLLKMTFSVCSSDDCTEGDYNGLFDALNTCVVGKKVDLFYYDCKLGDEGVTTRKYLMSDYYVEHYEIEKVENQLDDIVCHLICRSEDFKLTLEKGCEVFSSKTLGQAVFAEKLAKMETFKDKLSYEPSRLLNLGYHLQAKCRDGQHDAELIQPYLVRYNESIYDFLVRVSHRCGEFFYFDKNKLCLGLPAGTVKCVVEGKVTDGSSKNCYKLGSGYYCEYEDVGGADVDESDEVATNYLTGTSVPSGNSHYDVQLTSDDYLCRLNSETPPAENEPSLGNCTENPYWLYKAMAPVFASEDFALGLTSALGVFLQGKIDVQAISNPKRKEQFKKYQNNSSENAISSEVKNGCLNLENRYYHYIELQERKSEKNRVKINFSSTVPPIGIGDAVDVDDGMFYAYVVSKVSGTFSYSEKDEKFSSQQDVEAVPVFDVKELDTLKRSVFPPMQKISHSVKATAMEAIVMRVDDPLFLGRVKVKYPWQYSTKPANKPKVLPKKIDIPLSPWIRVQVPFTSFPGGSNIGKGGVGVPLSVGEHVLLNYVDGNLERPYVAGSLYFRYKEEGAVKPKGPVKGYFDNSKEFYYNTGYPTRAFVSRKGHGLTLMDNADTSPLEVLLPPLKPILALFDVGTFAKEHSWKEGFLEKLRKIKGGGLSLGDGTGLVSLEIDAGRRVIDFGSKLGSINATAFKGITINVPNGDINITGKTVSIEAGNNLTLRSGTNLRNRAGINAAKAGMLVSSMIGGVAADFLKETTGIDLKGCLDLSFLRCVMEIILRPVEGSLTLHSGRNAVMKAGNGEVSIPASLLSQKSSYTYLKNAERGNGLWSFVKTRKVGYNKTVIEAAIEAACRSVEEYSSAVTKYNTTLMDKVNEFVHSSSVHGGQAGYNIRKDYDTPTKAIDKFKVDNYTFPSKAEWYGEIGRNDYYGPQYQKDLNLSNQIRTLMNSYKTDIVGCGLLQKKFDENLKPLGFTVSKSTFPQAIQSFADGVDVYAEINDVFRNTDFLYTSWIKKLKRAAVVQVLSQCGEIRFENLDINIASDYILENDGHRWDGLVGAIQDNGAELQQPDSVATTFLKSAAKGALAVLGGGGEYSSETRTWKAMPQMQQLFNINGSAGPRAFSEVSDAGGIMCSNSEGQMLKLKDDTSGWEMVSNSSAEALRKALTNLHLE